jgi:hypothetical protein
MLLTVGAASPDLAELSATVERAWTRGTSADPVNWSAQNKAWGQCAVTALLVQDCFGGELQRGKVGTLSHYWNVLPSGEEVDLTRHQFADDVEISHIETRSRDYVLSDPETARRYRKLARAFRAHVQLLTRTR